MAQRYRTPSYQKETQTQNSMVHEDHRKKRQGHRGKPNSKEAHQGPRPPISLHPETGTHNQDQKCRVSPARVCRASRWQEAPIAALGASRAAEVGFTRAGRAPTASREPWAHQVLQLVAAGRFEELLSACEAGARCSMFHFSFTISATCNGISLVESEYSVQDSMTSLQYACDQEKDQCNAEGLGQVALLAWMTHDKYLFAEDSAPSPGR